VRRILSGKPRRWIVAGRWQRLREVQPDDPRYTDAPFEEAVVLNPLDRRKRRVSMKPL
jgi:hypothetical protein